MGKKIIFFDTTYNQILRVGKQVALQMKALSPDITIYGVVFETSGLNVCPKKEEHLFDDFFLSTKIKDINNYITSAKADVIVLCQNTIPDLDALLWARKNGARVMMMQHGLLYDGASINNVRIGEIFAALSKFKKTFTYFCIMHTMCKQEHLSYFKLVLTILKAKYNVTTTVQNYFTPALRGEKAFVIGKHWVDYYHDNYGYDKNDIFVMGNHDVDDLKENCTPEEALCYIPSVHVEDGHVTETVFLKYIDALSAAVPAGTKFYVKLHPRSDERLYKKLVEKNDAILIKSKELPYVSLYIGHNSSLLSKALQISGRLLLWEFKEEPELFYRDYALSVCSDAGSLEKAVKSALANRDFSKKESIEAFSYRNPEGAYHYCAKVILSITK